MKKRSEILKITPISLKPYRDKRIEDARSP